jgi:hypothetical protein
VFLWLANWWDGVDLWLSQLAFPFQFAIVIVVLAPVCFGIAVLVDRVVDLVRARLPHGGEDTADAGEPVAATAGRGPESSGS